MIFLFAGSALSKCHSFLVYHGVIFLRKAVAFSDDDDEDVDVSTLSAVNIDEDSARLRGELDEGDNVEVWFVIDDNDSTPSCSDDDIREDVSGRFDEDEDFTGIDYMRVELDFQLSPDTEEE